MKDFFQYRDSMTEAKDGTPKGLSKYQSILKKEREIDNWQGKIYDAARGHIEMSYKGLGGLKSLMKELEVEEEEFEDYYKGENFDWNKFYRSADGKELYNELIDEMTQDSWDYYSIDNLNEFAKYEMEKDVVRFYEFEYATNSNSVWYTINSKREGDLKGISGLKRSQINAKEFGEVLLYLNNNGKSSTARKSPPRKSPPRKSPPKKLSR